MIEEEIRNSFGGVVVWIAEDAALQCHLHNTFHAEVYVVEVTREFKYYYFQTDAF
jgi:hypothetical protein